MKAKEWNSGAEIRWPTASANLTLHQGSVEYHFLNTSSPVPDSKNCDHITLPCFVKQDSHMRTTDAYKKDCTKMFVKKFWCDSGARCLRMCNTSGTRAEVDMTRCLQPVALVGLRSLMIGK